MRFIHTIIDEVTSQREQTQNRPIRV